MAEYLAKGDYSIDVSLDGGSGKANIVSPAQIHADRNGGITAGIEWSSPHYDYMKVLERDYYPVNKSGNSRFVIDLDKLYEELPVTAETTAMSEPHMIDYTIYFDFSTLKNTNTGNAGYIFGGVGAAVILSAMTVFIRKRRVNAKN